MSNALTTSSTAIAVEDRAFIDRDMYPFEPRAFQTGSGTIRYVDVGRGRPILIAHGTPSWSFEWRNVIRALQHDHRVIAPDHLGFGLSDRTNEVARLTPEEHAKRLAALAASLDLRDAILIGHDFGGPIGLGALLSARERFSAMVLGNTWAWSLADRADVRRLSRIVASPLGKLLYLGLNASPRWIVPAAFGNRRLLTPTIHRHYTAPFPSWRSRLAPWKLGVELAGSASFYDTLWSRRGELATIPSAIVWGDADPTFREPELTRLSEALPQARISRLPGVGHFTAEEDPEAWVRAVRTVSQFAH
ncbi:MAG: alpha/beta fold hydrolase [Polyangiaceae bacterium]|nr:alpha/beta fold hydrolase [Polyangiaceae bacterium]